MSSLLPIWFCLFDLDGKPWPKTRAKKVLINPLADVDDFLEAVKAKYNEPNYLQNIPSGVYKTNKPTMKRKSCLKKTPPLLVLEEMKIKMHSLS
jgi:hypothetical protein